MLLVNKPKPLPWDWSARRVIAPYRELAAKATWLIPFWQIYETSVPGDGGAVYDLVSGHYYGRTNSGKCARNVHYTDGGAHWDKAAGDNFLGSVDEDIAILGSPLVTHCVFALDTSGGAFRGFFRLESDFSAFPLQWLWSDDTSYDPFTWGTANATYAPSGAPAASAFEDGRIHVASVDSTGAGGAGSIDWTIDGLHYSTVSSGGITAGADETIIGDSRGDRTTATDGMEGDILLTALFGGTQLSRGERELLHQDVYGILREERSSVIFFFQGGIEVSSAVTSSQEGLGSAESPSLSPQEAIGITSSAVVSSQEATTSGVSSSAVTSQEAAGSVAPQATVSSQEAIAELASAAVSSQEARSTPQRSVVTGHESIAEYPSVNVYYLYGDDPSPILDF